MVTPVCVAWQKHAIAPHALAWQDATLARFGALGRGLPAHIPRVNLVTPLPPAWQYSIVTPPPLAWQCLTLEKSYLFHTNSDGDEFYTKIVALNEIYNFIVLSFFIWIHQYAKIINLNFWHHIKHFNSIGSSLTWHVYHGSTN